MEILKILKEIKKYMNSKHEGKISIHSLKTCQEGWELIELFINKKIKELEPNN